MVINVNNSSIASEFDIGINIPEGEYIVCDPNRDYLYLTNKQGDPIVNYRVNPSYNTKRTPIYD